MHIVSGGISSKYRRIRWVEHSIPEIKGMGRTKSAKDGIFDIGQLLFSERDGERSIRPRLCCSNKAIIACFYCGIVYRLETAHNFRNRVAIISIRWIIYDHKSVGGCGQML